MMIIIKWSIIIASILLFCDFIYYTFFKAKDIEPDEHEGGV